MVQVMIPQHRHFVARAAWGFMDATLQTALSRFPYR